MKKAPARALLLSEHGAVGGHVAVALLFFIIFYAETLGFGKFLCLFLIDPALFEQPLHVTFLRAFPVTANRLSAQAVYDLADEKSDVAEQAALADIFCILFQQIVIREGIAAVAFQRTDQTGAHLIADEVLFLHCCKVCGRKRARANKTELPRKHGGKQRIIFHPAAAQNFAHFCYALCLRQKISLRVVQDALGGKRDEIDEFSPLSAVILARKESFIGVLHLVVNGVRRQENEKKRQKHDQKNKRKEYIEQPFEGPVMQIAMGGNTTYSLTNYVPVSAFTGEMETGQWMQVSVPLSQIVEESTWQEFVNRGNSELGIYMTYPTAGEEMTVTMFFDNFRVVPIED